ncbi:MAG: hypothetical protein KI785_12130, partial [Devosiaceae bacterium]|nr:hypothetical protein [Devosiaceae bacterium MH13]
DAVLKDFRFFLAGIANSAWDIPRRRAYWAAIQSDDCPRAFGLFWDVAASEMPYLDDLRYLPRLVERIRWQLLSPAVVDDLPDEWLAVGDLFDHRYLAACLAFEDSLFYDALIEGWAHEAGAQEILRPFVSYPQLVGALGSIHAARDSNAWHLVHLATQGPDGGYGPAGLLFAQLALTARSIAVPDDVVHMLLLRARQTWPVFDLEKPVPILLDSVERRLLMSAEGLSSDELARAERCFMTNEPFDRLFLGEEVYFSRPAEERCMAPDAR